MEGVDNPGLDIELNETASSNTKLHDNEAHSRIEVLADLTSSTESTNEITQEEEEDEVEVQQQSCSFIGNALEKVWTESGRWIENNQRITWNVFYIVLALLYNAYFVASVYYMLDKGIPMDWCNGVGFLIILTAIAYLGLFYFQVVKKLWGKKIYKVALKPFFNWLSQLWKYRVVEYGFYLVILAALITFLVIDTADERDRLYSFLGLIIFLIIGWVFSKHPSKVIWRQVIWGVALQFIFGLVVLRWDLGREIVQCLADKVTIFLSYTDAGSGFVYGYLVTDQNPSGIALGTIFAFQVLSVIYFFSFTVSILYYYGIMQWIVKKIGWLLQISIGTTAAESMNAAANIFLGQTEAPLIIKPFLPLMTKSELHAVMVGGFATIAGSVLAAYISFGIDAANLLSASVMSAPAALGFAKLFYPESEKSRTKAADIKVPKGTESNALDAAAQGASNAVFLVVNIIANLIAFLAFVAFLNGVISWFGDLLGAPYITFEWIMGKVFIPVAWLMGVPWSECDLVGNLVALKTIVNEFAAYSKLSEYIAAGLISKRSEIIATYALCGFSNPGSIGTQIAALSTMAPNRQSDLAEVAFRAFVAGSIACFMTACIAGTLVSSVDQLQPLAAAGKAAAFSSSTLSFMPNMTHLL